MLEYSFHRVEACNMCGAPPSSFQLLGLRLNRSQGMLPRKADGIAVAVKKCRRCELIFADPQPRPDRLSDHYDEPEEYWPASYFELDAAYMQREIGDAKRLLNFQSGMKALDIGAGIGKAMRSLSVAGFDTYGFEPSEKFRELAIERTGIDADRLQHAGIEDADYPPEFFDFVTFGAVLEHLQSPGESIEKALRWLKPEGIVHIEVPSSRYLLARLMNAYFRLWGTTYVTHISPMHEPFHLFEFGLESFRLHGRKAGYDIAFHEVGVGEILHLPRILHGPFRWYMDRSATGMQLTIYLRKSPPASQGMGVTPN